MWFSRPKEFCIHSLSVLCNSRELGFNVCFSLILMKTTVTMPALTHLFVYTNSKKCLSNLCFLMDNRQHMELGQNELTLRNRHWTTRTKIQPSSKLYCMKDDKGRLLNRCTGGNVKCFLMMSTVCIGAIALPPVSSHRKGYKKCGYFPTWTDNVAKTPDTKLLSETTFSIANFLCLCCHQSTQK